MHHKAIENGAHGLGTTAAGWDLRREARLDGDF
jgi:hypothetical protein